jgi:NAD(P)-dependent dehydrogenase (short-subunit alcohol dehydrogenase family)
LDGKVAIITGAGGGLGEAYARKLASEGAAIAVFEIRAEAAEKTADALTAQDHRAIAVPVDVSDRAAMRTAVEQVVERFGRVDILVSNAHSGSSPEGRKLPWYELPQRDWDRAMAVNIGGAFYGACAVAPFMIAQGYGKIVNIASTTFWSAAPHLSHYIASKGGVVGLTRALAGELGNSGVTVNAVSPGLTRTDNTIGIYPESFFQEYASRRAIPRIAETSDLVGAVLYFCSPASDFVTGQVLIVDGGTIFN